MKQEQYRVWGCHDAVSEAANAPSHIMSLKLSITLGHPDLLFNRNTGE